MLNTQVRPSRDLRNNYRDVVSSLDMHDHVIITNNGVGEAALINMEMFAKFEDFLHSRYIYEELQKSKAEMDNPNVELIGAKDVFAKFDKKLKEHDL